MGKGYRQGRLGEEIRRIISELLLKDLKDPGLSAMISITAVEVTSDGGYATVYLSVLERPTRGDENEEKEKAESQKKDVIAALQRAKGFIRNEIGRQVKLRHVPDLIFKIDESMEYGRHISKIIDSLEISHDQQDQHDEQNQQDRQNDGAEDEE